MVTQVTRPRSTGMAIGEALGNMSEGYFKGAGEHMQRQQLRQALESQGYNPAIADLPQHLQSKAFDHIQSQQESMQKQQQAQQMLQSQAQTALEFGADPSAVQRAYESGDSKLMSEIVKQSAKREYGWFGSEKEPKSQFRLSNAKRDLNQMLAAAGENPYQQQGIASQLGGAGAPPMPNQQQMPQNIRTIGPEERRRSIESNGQALNPQQQMDPQQSAIDRILNDPKIPAEQKQALRQKIQDVKGNEYSGVIPGMIGNFASAAAAAPFTGFGFGPLAHTFLGGAEERLYKKGEEQAQKVLETSQPGSPEYLDAQKSLESFKSFREPSAFNAFKSSEEAKEQYIRPLAKALGVETYIDPKNLFEKFAGKAGGVLANSAFARLLSGTASGAQLLKDAKLIGLAEGAGQLAESATGSPMVGQAVSTLGYIASLIKPGMMDGLVKNGYQNFRDKIMNGPNKKISAQPLQQALQVVRDEIAVHPNSDRARFLQKQLNAIDAKIAQISPEAAERLGFGKAATDVINPKSLFELDEIFGKEMPLAIQKNADRPMQIMRESLRGQYQPHYQNLYPVQTRGLIDARNLEASRLGSTKIEEGIKSVANIKTPLFSKESYLLKALTRPVAWLAHLGRIVKDNPIVRDEIRNIFKHAYDHDIAKVKMATSRLDNTLRKYYPEVRTKLGGK